MNCGSIGVSSVDGAFAARSCASAPSQRSRLQEIRDSLAARITEAEPERWTGEAERLRVSLAVADAKLAQADELAARRTTAVVLGMPAYRGIAAETASLRRPPWCDAIRPERLGTRL
jgi:hypothetical protein